MADKDLENVQRWAARRRTVLVLQIVKGKVQIVDPPMVSHLGEWRAGAYPVEASFVGLAAP